MRDEVCKAPASREIHKPCPHHSCPPLLSLPFLLMSLTPWEDNKLENIPEVSSFLSLSLTDGIDRPVALNAAEAHVGTRRFQSLVVSGPGREPLWGVFSWSVQVPGFGCSPLLWAPCLGWGSPRKLMLPSPSPEADPLLEPGRLPKWKNSEVIPLTEKVLYVLASWKEAERSSLLKKIRSLRGHPRLLRKDAKMKNFVIFSVTKPEI